MNEHERQICARLKLFRESVKWPLEAFAEEIEISPHKLIGIEYGRTPLKYKIAMLICQVFDVSAAWLVTGKGSMHGGNPFLLAVDFGPDLYKNRLLSDVYHKSPDLFNPREPSGLFSPIQKTATPGFDPKTHLKRVVDIWLASTKFRSALDAEIFARRIEEFALSVLNHYRNEGIASRVRFGKKKDDQGVALRAGESSVHDLSKKAMLYVHESVNTSSVRPLWPSLKKRLQDATREVGSKSRLAEFLGVKLASVSQWLTDSKSAREPGAETTLQMLLWVERQERKK